MIFRILRRNMRLPRSRVCMAILVAALSRAEHWNHKMKLKQFLVCAWLTVLVPGALLADEPRLANEPGLADLDEAMCEKVTAQGLRDMNQVIELTQSAIEQGLSAEDEDFAKHLLSDALMRRATALVRVNNVRSIGKQQIQQIRQQVVSDLRRVLAIDSPPPQAAYLLGKLMALPGGDPHESRRLLTQFLESEEISDPQRAEALIVRARVQNNEEKSLADFNEAIRLMPENANYLLVRALFHRSRKRLEQALADVASVLERAPKETNALILQGDILRAQGKLDEAIVSYNQASAIAPQAPVPYQSRGEIYRNQGKFDQAVEEFSKVLEMQPGVTIALIHRAEALLYSGKPEKALADVELALEREPGLVTSRRIAAHRIRAQVFANLGRLQDAIDEMSQLAEALPRQTNLRMQLALYYLVNQQPQKAIEAYTRVLQLDDGNFLALRSRGDTYLNLGKHAEAAADFRRALALNAQDVPLLNNYAWLLATSPHAEVRDGKRSLELAIKACELTEYQKSHILSTLAAAHAENGDFESAIKRSKQAVSIGDPEIREDLMKELVSYQSGKPWREDQLSEAAASQPGESQAAGSQSQPPPQAQEDPPATPLETPDPVEPPGAQPTQPPGQAADL